MAMTLPILGNWIARESGQSLSSDRWVLVRWIVIDIREQDAVQIALVEDHAVIWTLAMDRTDHALDIGVLPG
jgi:hypothetical protein